MATPTKFNSFPEALAEGVHDFANDTLKVALSNTLPSASDTQLSDITQITAANGYTAGGSTITVSSSSQSGGTYSLVLAALTFTASGGSIGPFRYVILYNDTATNDELICWFDRGLSFVILDGQSYTIDSATWLQIV